MTTLTRVLPGVALAAVSLLLFAYVGYGEATRVYVQIRMERLEQLGATLQAAVDQFANSGLPLDQFGGFGRRSAQLRAVDPAILAASLVDISGKPVDCEAEAAVGDRFCHAESLSRDPAPRQGVSGFGRLSDGDLRIDLPVRDKFAPVGAVVLHVDRERIERVVDEAFAPVFGISAGLFVMFAICLGLLARRGPSGMRWLTPVFLAMIAINLAVLVVVMFDLYRKGVEGQAEALARSMASRLSAATELGIPLSAFSGVGETLDGYRRINPNIAAISLVQQDRVLFSVDGGGQEAGLGSMDLHRLIFELPIEQGSGQDLVLSVQLPLSVVLAALGAGARNFVALFFGCAVFALVLLSAVR